MQNILIRDPGATYEQSNVLYAEMDKWAQTHCKSYVGFEVNDVSDFSLTTDQIGTYSFYLQQDANWFSLKWVR